MRVIFEYDFSDRQYRDGKDLIDIDNPHYKYSVDIQENEYDQKLIDLYKRYEKVALEYAAYTTMLEYSKILRG